MGFAHVASTVKGAGAANNCTTDPIDTTGADLLVVCVAWNLNALTLSDSYGNTWTALTQRSAGSNRCRIYYCANPTVGAGHTFTATGATVYPTIFAGAFSGAAASPYDQESGAAGLAPGAITPSGNGALLVTGLATTGASPTLASPWTTSALSYSAGNYIGGGGAWQVQTTAASVNPTWSVTGGTNPVSAMAAFLPASAGGGSIIPLVVHHMREQGMSA